MQIDEDVGTEVEETLESLKWYLWHGNVYEALIEFDRIEMLIYEFEETYPRFAKLERFAQEFRTYIE